MSVRVLSERDAAALVALVDRIFPPDDTIGGASELGVVDYIERQLAGPWGCGDDMYRAAPFAQPQDGGHGWQVDLSPAEAYRDGLAALRSVSTSRCGAPFEDLDGEAQDRLLRLIERGELAPFGRIGAAAFFALVHGNVVEGLFADPAHGGNRDGAVWAWIGHRP